MSIQPNQRTNWFYIYAPMLLSVGLIFYFSSLSRLPVTPSFNHQDKLHHFIAFFTLGYSLFRIGFYKQFSPKQTLILVVVCGTLYGFSDELHQLFVPNRVFDWWDLIADFLGCLTALFAGPSLIKLDNRIAEKLSF